MKVEGLTGSEGLGKGVELWRERVQCTIHSVEIVRR